MYQVVKVVCQRLQELAKCVDPNSHHHSADLDIMKRTAPGAFQSQRNQTHGDDSSVNSSCASLASMSSSQDDGSDNSLAKHRPSSPHLDLRKRMQRQRISEEVNDDNHKPKLAQSVDFSKSKGPRHNQVTRVPMQRLSTSGLVHPGESFDEIYMVAKAMIFDLDMDDGDDVDNPGGIVQVRNENSKFVRNEMNEWK